jgi:hypothetical protein
MSAPILEQDWDTFVESIELGFLTLATHGGVLCVLANRKPDPPALFAPFEVIGPFRVLFLSAVLLRRDQV